MTGSQRLYRSKPASVNSTPLDEAAIRCPEHPILQLQAAYGNQIVNRLLASEPLAGEPQSSLGQGRSSQSSVSNASPIQAKTAFQGISQALNPPCPAPGTGAPLPAAVQQKMETAFNADFSDVRIHQDEAAEQIGAIAFTRGSNIHFAPGEFNPTSRSGQILLIGQPGDRYEREADQVAESVVEQLNQQRNPSHAAQPPSQPATHVRSIVQRSIVQSQMSAPTAGSETLASNGLESAIQQAQGQGQPLEERVRLPMQQAFGADFSQVRLHTDAKSHRMNQQLRSRAFTSREHIFLRQGEYRPDHPAGQSLLAHELAHVVQQTGGVSQSQPLSSTLPKIQRLLYVGGNEYEKIANRWTEITDENRKKQDISDPWYRQVGIPVTYEEEKEKKTDFLPPGQVTDLNRAWSRLMQEGNFQDGIEQLSAKEVKQVKNRLKKWITREGVVFSKRPEQQATILMGKRSEKRIYQSWADVGVALLGEQGARKNKIKEKELAKTVSKSKEFRRDLAEALVRVHDWITENVKPEHWQDEAISTGIWSALENYPGDKFKYWFPKGQVKERMQNAHKYENHPSSNFVTLHEVLFFIIKNMKDEAWSKDNSPKLGHIHRRGEESTAAQIGAASFEKVGQHALIEKHPFVKAARDRNLPLGAGASNTTDLLMIFADKVGLEPRLKEAIAWAAFIFWNKKFKQVQAVRHTFHEIMDVASLRTGGAVEYDPDAADPYNVGYARQGTKQPLKPYKLLRPDDLLDETEASDIEESYDGKQEIEEEEDGIGIMLHSLSRALTAQEINKLREDMDFQSYFKRKDLEKLVKSDSDLTRLATALGFDYWVALKSHIQSLLEDENSPAETKAPAVASTVKLPGGFELTPEMILDLQQNLDFRKYFQPQDAQTLLEARGVLLPLLKVTLNQLGEALAQLFQSNAPQKQPAQVIAPGIAPLEARKGQIVNDRPVPPTVPQPIAINDKQRLDARRKEEREWERKKQEAKQRMAELKRNRTEELRKAKERLAKFQ